GLAGPGGGRDEDVLALLQMAARLDLEVVEFELGSVHEASQRRGRELRARPEFGVSLRGAQRLARGRLVRTVRGISHSSLRRCRRAGRPTGPAPAGASCVGARCTHRSPKPRRTTSSWGRTGRTWTWHRGSGWRSRRTGTRA